MASATGTAVAAGMAAANAAGAVPLIVPQAAPASLDLPGSERYEESETRMLRRLPPVEPDDDEEVKDEPAPVVAPRRRRAQNPEPDLSTYDRLRLGPPRDRLMGWLVTIAISLVAAVVRLVNLGYPNKLVFDETYYAKDAYTLWKYGYELSWPDNANDSIVAGNPDVYLTGNAEFVVHPPVGKYLIGLGEQLFGMNSFGWRIMPLVFGVLLVFMTIRLARRLSRSTLIGGIAGVLLTFDGLAFTMSRVALLDIFQAVFLVAAVACCVADRDYYRARLADRLEALGVTDLEGRFGPVVVWRPWRLASGILFGLAIGTKWNSVFLLAVMGVVCVAWDIGARRLAGADWHAWMGVLVDGVPAFIRMVVVAAIVYVATWARWFLTSGGYDRDWGAKNPTDPLVQGVGGTFASFIHYQQDILAFHTGEYMAGQTHPYDANPIGWLLMVRPIGIDAVNDIAPGTDGCPAGTETCLRVVSGMGTPILWWLALAALIVAVIWRFGARDWRFGLPVIAMLATYVPWFFTTDRPEFFFYAITMVPFTVIALAMVLGLVLGPQDGEHRRRGGIIVGVVVALVLANFAWIYPVLTDGLLTQSQWLARMWLRSWI